MIFGKNILLYQIMIYPGKYLVSKLAGLILNRGITESQLLNASYLICVL